MCMNKPDPGQSSDAIQRAAATGNSNLLANMARRTVVGQQVDAGNRGDYIRYATDEQMAGRQPVPYAQWLQINRHAR